MVDALRARPPSSEQFPSHRQSLRMLNRSKGVALEGVATLPKYVEGMNPTVGKSSW
jgi:hypothetical protein